jgi:hypothetical protein
MTLASVHPGTIAATALGLIAAVIVWASMANAPVLGSDRASLIALVVVGFAMCIAAGTTWAPGQFPTSPLSVVAAVAGISTLIVLGAVVFGWGIVIDPIGGVLFGSGSTAAADKVGVIAVGVLLGFAWLAATIRQLGALTTVGAS